MKRENVNAAVLSAGKIKVLNMSAKPKTLPPNAEKCQISADISTTS